jgi:hypothetical protein
MTAGLTAMKIIDQASIMSRNAERSWRKARMPGRSSSGTRSLSICYQAFAPRSADRRSSVTGDPGAAAVLRRSAATTGPPITAYRLRPDVLTAISEL